MKTYFKLKRTTAILFAASLYILFSTSCRKEVISPENTNSNASFKSNKTKSVPSYTLNNGLIAYWPFDNSGTDASGNGHTASLNNMTATYDRFGNPTGAFYFNGYNSYAQVSDAYSLRLNGTDFTMTGWVQLYSYNASYNSSIMSKRYSGANNGWFFGARGYLGAPTGQVIYGPGGGSANAFSSGSVGLYSWHMVTCTYDNTTGDLSIYIDGVLDNVTGSILTANGSITADLFIGMDSPTGDYFLDGVMDDLRIYDRVITYSEIQELYYAVPAPEGNLIAYWTFDATGYDFSGNGHTASLNNMTSTTDRLGNPYGAYAFNGSTSYAQVSDAYDLRLYNTDFTLNSWVYMNGYNSSYNSSIMSKRYTGANNGWFYGIRGYLGAPTGQVIYGPGGGSTNAFSSGTVGLYGWHMVTAVYDLANQQLSIYIDGSLDSVTPYILTSNGSVSADLFIGMDSPTNDYFLDGALDDIRIYGRQLNSSEVNQLYYTIY
ncbi:LamG domain-containing protein [Hufsiella ginkgonis]|uniref:LamG-like jellyroll fold domain-containing protein n=1 Tax=Hufsiella ginkgonis TaxID=2695274 RepID=A0A7K1Y3Q9_9SPHI|nr:LamG domain-containing protein [Hufsiella ginkgonis]MXV17923.1 hypothetical protein [Hufsiella ginkgonis]